MFESITAKIGRNHEKQFEIVNSLSRGQKAIFAVWLVEAEVNNGGFNQFYFNSGGEFSTMAEEGFKLLGAFRFNDLMAKANRTFEENRERLAQFDDGTLESFSKSYENNPLNELDDEFYDLYDVEDLDNLKIEYIRSNPEEFVM